MRGQRLLIVTLGVAILVSFCSSIESNATDHRQTERRGRKRINPSLRQRLSEMAKEFGATSFEETSEEMTSRESSEAALEPKQHVKRLVSAEQIAEFQVYQGVMGRPGVDFPVLQSIPKTGFSCRQVKSSGYYADLDTDCQVFHICADGRKISFLCPNGTIFRQSHLICDWWWTVDCASSREHYEESAELLANDRKVYQARSDALSKSRSRQRGNRKPGIIRDFEGASASVTSYNTEPNPQNARIQVHSKVINPSKQYPSSTANPINNGNVFSSSGFEYQNGGSIEQAEQRSIHSFQQPYHESRTRHPNTGQYSDSRQPSQSRKHTESRVPPQEIGRNPQLNQFSQNVLPAQGTPDPRQITPSKQFSEIRAPPKVQPTSQSLQTSHIRFSQNRQQPQHLQIGLQQNFQQPQQLQNNQRQPQFHLESQKFPYHKEIINETRTYNHVRFFPSSDAEHQLPAETGSFVNNRGNQLNSYRQPSPRPSKQRITASPYNHSSKVTSKSYVELDRSRTTTAAPSTMASTIALSQTMKPIVVQVTDHGLSGLSNKQISADAEIINISNNPSEIVTEENPFDDDGFPEPPSEEQFKDEDLFYLHGTSTEKDSNPVLIATDPPLKLENRKEPQNKSEEVDLVEDLGLSAPPSDIQFKVEDLGGAYRETGIQTSSESILFSKSTQAPEVSTTQLLTNANINTGNKNSLPGSNRNFSGKKSHRFRTPTPTTTTTNPSPTISEYRHTEEDIVHDTTQPSILQSTTDQYIISNDSLKLVNEQFIHKNKSNIKESFNPNINLEIKPNGDFVNILKIRDSTTATPLISMNNAFTGTSIAPATVQSETKRLNPIFVEIINRGSSEPPLLKTYTVEELEKKRQTTESPSYAEKEEPNFLPSSTSLSLSTNKRFKTPTTTIEPTEGTELSTSSTSIMPSSPVTLSERVQPPLSQKLTQTSPSPIYDESTHTSTSIPATTLYFTLSRRVQPPVLILSSSDPRDKNKLRKAEISSESLAKEGEGTIRSRSKMRTKSTSTENTTPISLATLSRRVQPPAVNFINNFTDPITTPSAVTVDKETISIAREQNQNVSVVDSNEEFPETTNPTPPSSKKPATYVEIKRHRTTTVPVPISLSTKSNADIQAASVDRQFVSTHKQIYSTEFVDGVAHSVNSPFEVGNFINESVTADPGILVPKSLHLKQDPTSSPQYGNRDGLDIPTSSGPSTLHSLAVYFASKDNDQETTTSSPTLESSNVFDSRKQKEDSKTSAEEIYHLSSTVQPELFKNGSDDLITVNETNLSILAPNFLTKSTRDSYSALFPDTTNKQTDVTEKPLISMPVSRTLAKNSKVRTNDRKTSDSSHNILKSELLDKLAEISQMESATAREKIYSTTERLRPRTDTEDLLQGTDSRDLRELAQIFSRALSAYLEDPEEFKKVLIEVRPKDPSNVNIDKDHKTKDDLLEANTARPVVSTTSIFTSSTKYSLLMEEDDDSDDEDDEVLDFSDVPKIPRRKLKSTTPVPAPLKSTKPLIRKISTSTTITPIFSTIPDVNFVTDSSLKKKDRKETSAGYSQYYSSSTDDIDLKPPKEQLINAQSSYYALSSSNQQQFPTGTTVTPEELYSTSVAPNTPQEDLTDYTLPPGTKQYNGPGYGPQTGEGNYAPTAGGVNDQSRPRYGGFQNNSKISRKTTPQRTESQSTKTVSTEASASTIPSTRAVRYKTRSSTVPVPVSTALDIQTDSEKSVKDVPASIGSILNTFIPEEVNNLAVVGETQNNPSELLPESVFPTRSNEGNDEEFSTKLSSKEALIGADSSSFTLPQQFENQPRLNKKIGNSAARINVLAINRELGTVTLDTEGTSTTPKHNSYLPSETTERINITPTSDLNSRTRSSTSLPVSFESITSSSNKLGSLSNISTEILPTSFNVTVSSQSQTHTPYQPTSKLENLNLDNNENQSYDDESSSDEEFRQRSIPDVTFYSEKNKPSPPPSASLIRTTGSKKNKFDVTVVASVPKNASEEVLLVDESSEKSIISAIPSAGALSQKNQPTQQTLSSSTILPKSTLPSRKSSSKNRSDRNQRRYDSFTNSNNPKEEPMETTISDTFLRISQLSKFSTPLPFTETTLAQLVTTEIITSSEQQESIINFNNEFKELNRPTSNPDSALSFVDTSTSTPQIASRTVSPRRIASSLDKSDINTSSSNNEKETFTLKYDNLRKDRVLFNSTTVSPSIFNSTSGRGSAIDSAVRNGTRRSKSLHKQRTKSTSNSVPLNDSKNINYLQQPTTQSSTPSVEHTLSVKPTTVPIMRLASNVSEITLPNSRKGSSFETTLTMSDVTSEQLQVLEDLQTMLFPVNKEDGTVFGNLNQSSTLSLINTMKQAVTNSTVRRIVLLLVESLKETNPEEARLQLIEALLRMPVEHELSASQEKPITALLQQRVGKKSDKSSQSLQKDTLSEKNSSVKISGTDTEIPSQIVTIKQPYSEIKSSTTSQPPATTFRTRGRKIPHTSTMQVEPIVTTTRSKARRPLKVRTTTESPVTEQSIAISGVGSSAFEDLATDADSLPQSDARAVELLRSLYSLASRWG